MFFMTMCYFYSKDFEALTPNLLARTIETVEGGGLVVILLRTMNSLKQLYTMTMVNYFWIFEKAFNVNKQELITVVLTIFIKFIRNL